MRTKSTDSNLTLPMIMRRDLGSTATANATFNRTSRTLKNDELRMSVKTNKSAPYRKSHNLKPPSNENVFK